MEKLYFLLLLLGFSKTAEACSVCFGGDPSSPQIVGLKWGIFVLLGILSVILTLFALFFLNLRKKSKLSVGN
ncbi:MAG: hypothetical protein KBD53_00175 [Candidatus Omnitrophica bacterium]|nr:hypothetical protein [Candidatus Omnitrophota bacterium]